MNQFVNLLKTEILKELPGTEVQWEMASMDRMIRNFPRAPRPDARAASVLILLYPHKGSVYTVLMQRHDYDGVHGGQISFPGGKQEPTDENAIQTALREANEETGVNTSLISVIGTLTPLFIPVSNMLVTTVIGWIDNKPHFNHQAEEVVYLFDLDIKRLLDNPLVKRKTIEVRGIPLEIKYFDYDGKVIWGATAMILHELLTILRRGYFSLEV
jgi:8-oxo-dGTP pyrophosphatase MutT (NUDIX family)